MTINNFPAYAKAYRFIVTRSVDGEEWYYGAWDDRESANEQALEIGGSVWMTALLED